MVNIVHGKQSIFNYDNIIISKFVLFITKYEFSYSTLLLFSLTLVRSFCLNMALSGERELNYYCPNKVSIFSTEPRSSQENLRSIINGHIV